MNKTIVALLVILVISALIIHIMPYIFILVLIVLSVLLVSKIK